MDKERRSGLVDIAKEVGRLGGTQEQLIEKINSVVDEFKQTNQNLRETNKSIEEIRRIIPSDHLEVHAIINKKLEAANNYAKFWHDIRCWIAVAISTNSRKAIFLLILAAIVAISGNQERAGKILHKAGESLGLVDPPAIQKNVESQ